MGYLYGLGEILEKAYVTIQEFFDNFSYSPQLATVGGSVSNNYDLRRDSRGVIG
jgi:hypothetical protein